MLKKLRKKKTAKRIWIILIILILPAFLFWGIGSYVRSKQEDIYVGRIFGKKITAADYKDSLEAVKIQSIIQYGDNLSEIQKYLNLESQAWDRLLLLAEAKKRKIKASNQEVVDSIQSYPFFQNKGQFDNQRYLRLLENYFRIQPRIFEEQTRQYLTLSKLYKEVTDSANLTEEEIKKEYFKLNEQVSIYYILSDPLGFAKDITVSDSEIKDYFAKNSFKFKQPLSFNLEYISLDPDNKNAKTIEDTTKEIFLRLKKKEDFIKVAQSLNMEVKITGLFNQTGPIPGIGWSPPISELVSKLKVGEFAPPIQMDKYYYILRLKDRKEPYIPDFESIKGRVKEAFIKERSEETAKQKIEDCLKELEATQKVSPKEIDFNKLAKIYGLKSESTNFFKFGSYIEGVGASDKFFMEARRLKEEEFSNIINMPSGFYIIKLKSKMPVDEKKFSEEKPAFSMTIVAQKKEEYFSKFAEGLKKQMQMF